MQCVLSHCDNNRILCICFSAAAAAMFPYLWKTIFRLEFYFAHSHSSLEKYHTYTPISKHSKTKVDACDWRRRKKMSAFYLFACGFQLDIGIYCSSSRTIALIMQCSQTLSLCALTETQWNQND